MHTETGELISLEDLKKKSIEEQSMFVKLSELDYEECRFMNRHERRKWLKQNRARVNKYNKRGE